MNVYELRAAFNLSESMVDRFTGFRKARIDMLREWDLHEETPVRLGEEPRLVLHVVPISFADLSNAVDLAPLVSRAVGEPSQWVPLFDHYIEKVGIGAETKHFNFDGVIATSHVAKDATQARYIQVFRRGAVEFVCGLHDFQSPSEEQKGFSLHWVERMSLDGLRCALHCQKNLGIDPPLIIMLSVLNAGAYTVFSDRKLGRDILLFPDTVLEDYGEDLVYTMKPVYTILWNTVGVGHSPSYDDAGKWTNPNYPQWRH